MMYCPKCAIDYEEGKMFCKKCGSKLELKKEPDIDLIIEPNKSGIASPIAEASGNSQRYCSSCNIQYQSDKYFCKNCGGQLIYVRQDESEQTMTKKTKREPNVIPNETLFTKANNVPSKFKVKSILRRSKKLYKKGQKFRALITNLEKQKGIVSEEALDITLKPYQLQHEAIKKEIKEIDDYLKCLQKELAGELEGKQKELNPHKNRLVELRKMRNARGLTFIDYRKIRAQPKRMERRLRREIKKKQRIINIIRSFSISDGMALSLPVMISGGIVLLCVLFAASYFTYTHFFYKDIDVNPSQIAENQADARSDTSNNRTLSAEQAIRVVFENIKQANINKDIDLFMSCYSISYPYLEAKKDTTLSNWNTYDFLNLIFFFKNLTIKSDIATVTVDWIINARNLNTQQIKTFKPTNSVTLRYENGGWRIISLK